MGTENAATHSGTLMFSFECLAGRAGPEIGRKEAEHIRLVVVILQTDIWSADCCLKWLEGLDRIGNFISHLKGCQLHPDALKIHSILSWLCLWADWIDWFSDLELSNGRVLWCCLFEDTCNACRTNTFNFGYVHVDQKHVTTLRCI